MRTTTTTTTTTTSSHVANVIRSAIDASDKTNAEIAAECGFGAPNMISLITTGRSKMPIGRVKHLARSLDLPVAELAELVIREYQPELWDLLETAFPSCHGAPAVPA